MSGGASFGPPVAPGASISLQPPPGSTTDNTGFVNSALLLLVQAWNGNTQLLTQVLNGIVDQIAAAGGTITGVTAGVGLTGGGTIGTVTLNLFVPVAIVNGGTGATTAPAALLNLGAAPINNPVFTGDPQAPTPPPGDSDTSIATTAFVQAAITATYPVTVPQGGTGLTTLTAQAILFGNGTSPVGLSGATTNIAGLVTAPGGFATSTTGGFAGNGTGTYSVRPTTGGGSLSISPQAANQNALLILNQSTAGQFSYIEGRAAGTALWQVLMPNSTADFAINKLTGSNTGNQINISQSTSAITMPFGNVTIGAPPASTMGIGDVSVASTVVINRNSAALPSSTGLLPVIRVNFADADAALGPVLLMDGYSTFTQTVMRRAGGTGGSPTGVLINQNIGGHQFRGYGTTGYGGPVGRILCVAAEAFTDTAQGAQIVIATNLIGTTTLTNIGLFDTGGAKLLGTPTNDNAASGFYGEVITALNSAGSALTTATPLNVTSVSLTAGDWDVDGSVQFLTSTATPTNLRAWINTVSATIPAITTLFPQVNQNLTFTANVNQQVSTGSTRVSLATTTTVFLGAQAAFAAGSINAAGWIIARRAR